MAVLRAFVRTQNCARDDLAVFDLGFYDCHQLLAHPEKRFRPERNPID